MILSCCIWALSGPEEEVLRRIAGAGFRWIDVRPDLLEAEGAPERLRDLGLQVSCMATSFGVPEGGALDSPEEEAVAQAMAHTEKALEFGASLGARVAYVVPEADGSEEALARYARSLARAADWAAERGLKLCIEPFPGRSLSTAAATLGFIRRIGHPNLYLLLDVGHAQVSGEEPAEVVESAGDRLGYVHLDDNDGRNDQHLSLTDGVLTEETLRRTFAALAAAGYDGAVSLELNPQLPDPLAGLQESRQIVEKVADLLG